MIQARDIMTAHLVTVGMETPVPSVARLFVERGISGVPVVNTRNEMVGIVTEGDLLRRTELGTEKHRSGWRELFVAGSQLATEYVQAHGRTAGDVMTRAVIEIAPDTELATIVDILERNGIKRVPVVDKGKLVGIVSRADVMRALESMPEETAEPSAGDRRVCDEVLAEFRRLPWGLNSESNIRVIAGVVHLWGLVSTPEERAALRVAAQAIPGVRGVEDHTILVRARFTCR